jgi:hypothetical protein
MAGSKDSASVAGALGGTRGGPLFVRTILQDALVLKAPPKSSGTNLNKTQEVLVRATDKKAAQIAFAADHGKVWLTLRPKAGAENSPPSLVTHQSLLLGTGRTNSKGRDH